MGELAAHGVTGAGNGVEFDIVKNCCGKSKVFKWPFHPQAKRLWVSDQGAQLIGGGQESRQNGCFTLNCAVPDEQGGFRVFCSVNGCHLQ